MIDVQAAMSRLAINRPLFHSEADFQHALAWQIHQQSPSAAIRLEYRSPELPNRAYLDMWVVDGSDRIAIELKYKTRAFTTAVAGEQFELLDQSAQNYGRYDTLKDLHRLEQLVAGRRDTCGYLVLLTNDRSYWAGTGRPGALDLDFRLYDGRVVTGELRWGGTETGRSPLPLPLAGSYTVQWQDYSRVNSGTRGLLRYVVIPVGLSSG